MRKGSYKLISCFLAVLLVVQSFNTVMSRERLAYGDTLDGGQAVSTIVEGDIDENGASEKEEEHGVDNEKGEEEIPKTDNVESSVENNDEDYIEAEDNVYISPEDVVAREESENTLNSPQIIDEPEDMYIYEPVNSFETFANNSYPENVNGDGMIDEKDLDLVATKYNLKSGDSGYTAKYDINGDGIIDLFDLTLISSKLGTVCGKLIAIDPGHGGSDSGAVNNSTGLKEKTVVLNVGLMVRDMLIEKGYRVIMTRTADYRLSEVLAEDLKKRAEIANDANADLFVSIHANSVDGAPSAHGTETFYHKNLSASSAAAKLADSIQTKVVNVLKQERVANGMNVCKYCDRGVKTADFSVLRNTKMDAALVELAFISNAEEEKLLKSEEYQRNAAKAIVEGIVAGSN